MFEDRRQFLKLAGGVGAATALGLATNVSKPLYANELSPTSPDWLSLAGTSIHETAPTQLTIEGRLPSQLSGTLFRNGPGLFERDGVRKTNVLDGDGLVQQLSLRDGQAIHQSKFVRTEKYVEEEKSGRYTYATWTTRAPGGLLNNLGASNFKTQAGVTAYHVNGRLFALDEVSPIYELDPDTLETKAPILSGMTPEAATKAHTKLDAKTGDWIVMGGEFGPTMKMHAAIHHPDSSITRLPTVEAPRQVYTHDFFATENYLIVNLHPAELSLVPFLTGLASFTDSLEWNAAEGNLIAIIPKDGAPARFLDAPTSWMWHAANAYEQGNTIIADFAGYDDPDHFIGKDPAFTSIMTGRRGNSGAPGLMRRYIIDLDTNRLREEIVAEGGFEFPSIDPREACHSHRMVYATVGDGKSIFHSGLASINMESAAVTRFDFGDSHYVGEPVFAPDPTKPEAGWLITQVLDGTSGTSFFAVFDAAHVDAGPLAKVRLTHHLPISFHGSWSAA
jgi:all-trans-8'-apo-beta-carotenal 15,15'-oxygenase